MRCHRQGAARGRVAALGMVVAMVLATTGSTAHAKTRRPPPPAWDPGIEAIADEVGELYGEPFDEPVRVRLLAERDFRTAAGLSRAGAVPAREVRRIRGDYVALGLLPPDIDLRDDLERSTRSLRGYFTAFPRRQIVVRGDRLTPVTEVVVAHELTHALQHQVYGSRLYRARGPWDSVRGLAARALVEGDATRVMLDYEAAAMPARDTPRLGAHFGVVETLTGPEHADELLTVLSYVPYAWGRAMTQTSVADGGDRALRALYADPPTGDRALLDPVALFDAPPTAAAVPRPQLSDGEQSRGRADRLGAVLLYLMLASRIDLGTAFDGASAWDGDRLVWFTGPDGPCARVHVRARDGMLDVLREAVDHWVAASTGAASAMPLVDGVEITSCGSAAPALPAGATAGPALAAQLRAEFAASEVARGTATAELRCAADHYVHHDAVVALPATAWPTNDVDHDAITVADRRARRDARAACAGH